MDSIYNADGKIVEYEGSVFCMTNPVVVWGADPGIAYIVSLTNTTKIPSRYVPHAVYGACVQNVSSGRVVTGFTYLSSREGFVSDMYEFDALSGEAEVTSQKHTSTLGVITVNGVCSATPFRTSVFVESPGEILAEAIGVVRAQTLLSSFFIAGEAYTAQDDAQALMSGISFEYQTAVLALGGWKLYTPVSVRSFLDGTRSSADKLFFALLSPLEVDAYATVMSYMIDDYASRMCFSLTGCMLAVAVISILAGTIVHINLEWLSHSYVSAMHRMLYSVSTLFLNPVAQWSDAFSAAPSLIGPNVGYAAPYFMLIDKSRKVLEPSACDGGPVRGIMKIQLPSMWRRFWLHTDWDNTSVYEERHMLYQVNCLFPEDFIFVDGFVIARANYREINCSNCINDYCTPEAHHVNAQVGLLSADPSSSLDTSCSPYSVWKAHLHRLSEVWENSVRFVTTTIVYGTHYGHLNAISCGEGSSLHLRGCIDYISDAIPTGVCISTPLKELLSEKIKDPHSGLQLIEVSSDFIRCSVHSEDELYFTVSFFTNVSEYPVLTERAFKGYNLCAIPFAPSSSVLFLPYFNNPFRGWFMRIARASGELFTQEVRVYKCRVRYGAHVRLNLGEGNTVASTTPEKVEILDVYFEPDPDSLELLSVYPFEGRPVLVKSYLGYKQKQLIFHTDTELVYIQVHKESESDPDVGSVVHTIRIPSPPAPVYAVADLRVFEEVISLLAKSR